MEAFSALLAICAGNSPVPGEFPTQRPVTRSFGVFFDLRLNKRLSKQSWGWWLETLSRPLWRHRNWYRFTMLLYFLWWWISCVVSWYESKYAFEFLEKRSNVKLEWLRQILHWNHGLASSTKDWPLWSYIMFYIDREVQTYNLRPWFRNYIINSIPKYVYHVIYHNILNSSVASQLRV